MVDQRPSDRQLCQVFLRLGLDGEFFHEYVDALRSTSAAQEAGLDGPLHSSTKGFEGVSRGEEGSKAGFGRGGAGQGRAGRDGAERAGRGGAGQMGGAG